MYLAIGLLHKVLLSFRQTTFALSKERLSFMLLRIVESLTLYIDLASFHMCCVCHYALAYNWKVQRVRFHRFLNALQQLLFFSVSYYTLCHFLATIVAFDTECSGRIYPSDLLVSCYSRDRSDSIKGRRLAHERINGRIRSKYGPFQYRPRSGGSLSAVGWLLILLV